MDQKKIKKYKTKSTNKIVIKGFSTSRYCFSQWKNPNQNKLKPNRLIDHTSCCGVTLIFARVGVHETIRFVDWDDAVEDIPLERYFIQREFVTKL